MVPPRMAGEAPDVAKHLPSYLMNTEDPLQFEALCRVMASPLPGDGGEGMAMHAALRDREAEEDGDSGEADAGAMDFGIASQRLSQRLFQRLAAGTMSDRHVGSMDSNTTHMLLRSESDVGFADSAATPTTEEFALGETPGRPPPGGTRRRRISDGPPARRALEHAASRSADRDEDSRQEQDVETGSGVDVGDVRLHTGGPHSVC